MADTVQISASLKQIYGDNLNKKYPLKGSKVLIGRAYNAQVRLTNGNVSRRHCTLNCNDDKSWTVQDNSSQNGTFVNGIKLVANNPRPLQSGDIIFLGPPCEMPETFCFEICYGSEDVIFSQEEEQSVLENKTETEATCNILQRDNLQSPPEEIDLEMQVPISETSLTDPENSVIVVSPNAYSNAVPIITEVSDMPSSSSSNNKRKCEMESSQFPTIPLDEQKVSKRCKTSKNAMTDELNISNLDNQICEVSSSAVDQAEDSESLLNDDKDVIPCLSPRSAENEMLKAKLASMTAKVIELKKTKAHVLRICKKAYKAGKQCQKDVIQKNLEENLQDCEKKVKKEILEKFEEDLNCNICTELLMKPSVLECSHTFCEFCITIWKKKKNECPICRRKIQSVTRVLTLENFIDKAVQTLTPEQKVKREEMIKDRTKALCELKKAPKSPCQPRNLRRRRAAAGSSRNVPGSPRQAFHIPQRRLNLMLPSIHIDRLRLQPVHFGNPNFVVPVLANNEMDHVNVYLS